MDQGAQFIKDQLSQGRTAEQIKDLLRSNGWQEPQIQAAFASLQPVVPLVPAPAPVVEPKPVAPEPTLAKKMVPTSVASSPAAATNPTAIEPRKWLLPVTLALVTLLVLGGGGFWAYQKYFANKATSEASPIVTPEPATKVYSDVNISFSYPGTWKYSTPAELNGTADTKSTSVYFFTADNWTKAQQLIATEKANPSTDLGAAMLTLGQIYGYASFNIDHVTNITAAGCPTDLAAGVSTDCIPFTSDKTAGSSIETFLKTTYAPDGTSRYDSSTTVDPSLIKKVTINNITAYWGVNGPAGNQGVELAVPTTGGAETFFFRGVTDIATLQGEVLAVYKSIKVL